MWDGSRDPCSPHGHWLIGYAAHMYYCTSLHHYHTPAMPKKESSACAYHLHIIYGTSSAHHCIMSCGNYLWNLFGSPLHNVLWKLFMEPLRLTIAIMSYGNYLWNLFRSSLHNVLWNYLWNLFRSSLHNVLWKLFIEPLLLIIA